MGTRTRTLVLCWFIHLLTVTAHLDGKRALSSRAFASLEKLDLGLILPASASKHVGAPSPAELPAIPLSILEKAFALRQPLQSPAVLSVSAQPPFRLLRVQLRRNSDLTAKSSSNIGETVGIAIGATCGGVVVIAGVVYWLHRRKRLNASQAATTHSAYVPFTDNQPGTIVYVQVQPGTHIHPGMVGQSPLINLPGQGQRQFIALSAGARPPELQSLMAAAQAPVEASVPVRPYTNPPRM
jgi:hypothetical protein